MRKELFLIAIGAALLVACEPQEGTRQSGTQQNEPAGAQQTNGQTGGATNGGTSGGMTTTNNGANP